MSADNDVFSDGIAVSRLCDAIAEVAADSRVVDLLSALASMMVTAIRTAAKDSESASRTLTRTFSAMSAALSSNEVASMPKPNMKKILKSENGTLITYNVAIGECGHCDCVHLQLLDHGNEMFAQFLIPFQEANTVIAALLEARNAVAVRLNVSPVAATH